METGSILLMALLGAFALDRGFGEPAARWHPVVWMGRYLDWAGRRIAARERVPTADWPAFWRGALAWSVAAGALVLVAWQVEAFVLSLGGLLAAALLAVLLKPMLAWRMLREEVMAVEGALAESLDAGRAQLGRLVSRDVLELQEGEVRESAIESLAENLNDSVVAPVFWFLVAGLPGAVLYRFANTADAMWGYRGLRAGRQWEWAGKWAARADDGLSWVPARATALLLALVAGGIPPRRLRAEAAQTPSPNSGWPMAAMALALRVRLGKPGVYTLNARGEVPDAGHVERAGVLAGRAVGALLLAAALVLYLKGPFP